MVSSFGGRITGHPPAGDEGVTSSRACEVDCPSSLGLAIEENLAAEALAGVALIGGESDVKSAATGRGDLGVRSGPLGLVLASTTRQQDSYCLW